MDPEVLEAELAVPEWCHQITTTQPCLHVQSTGGRGIRKNARICLLLSEHQTNPLLNKRTGVSEGGVSFPENWLSEDWINSTVGTSEQPVGLC